MGVDDLRSWQVFNWVMDEALYAWVVAFAFYGGY
jgi:hypothetical protein